MRSLPKSGFVSMPWKNGGGETIEIMKWPQDGDLSHFDWRISMAQVASDGPFSVFPQIDRHLAVLAGKGMVLTIGDDAPVHLKPDGKTHAFAGDRPTSATLTDGPITDLNVMVRRGLWQAEVSCHVMSGSRRILVDEDFILLLVQDGALQCSLASNTVSLAQGDAVLFTQQDASVLLQAPMRSRVWQINLRQHKKDQI